MESLESLSKFLEAMVNFSWANYITLIARVPPDIDVDLKKATSKWRVYRFSCDDIGAILLKDLIKTQGQAIQIKEIRITTYPGSLRVSNEFYCQNQLATKKVLGWSIDIMPRKRDKPDGNSQIVIINQAEFKRFGDPQFTKSFLTDELKVQINDFNSKHARKPAKQEITVDFLLKLSTIVGANSLQTQQPIRRTEQSDLRIIQVPVASWLQGPNRRTVQ
jgi:hypothetical protein